MKLKTLHGAIIYILNREKRNLTFQEISDTIKSENLWHRKSDNLFPEEFQIRLRTVVQKRYKPLFKRMDKNSIQLAY